MTPDPTGNPIGRFSMPSRLWPLRGSVIVALVILITLSVALALAGTLPPATAAGGLAIIWIAALPGLLYLQGVAGGAVPLLPYAAFYYLLFFGVIGFAGPLTYQAQGKVVIYSRVALDAMSPEIIWLIALGVASLVGAFYLARLTVLTRMPRFRLPKAENTANTLNLIFWALMVSSLAYRYSTFVQSLPSIGQLLDPVGYLALGGFYLQWRAGRLPLWQGLLVLTICLPLDIWWRIADMTVTNPLLLPLFFTFVLWRERQFKAISVLIAAGIVGALLYNVTNLARPQGDTAMDKLAAAGQHISKLITQFDHIERVKVDVTNTPLANLPGNAYEYDPRISILIHRMGHIWMFQHVYEQSPDPIPYWGGETYRPLLTSFIPRAIYPAKPEERTGAAFGYRYRLTVQESGRTSFNMPWILELLANFGPVGVPIGMALFGLFFAFLDRVFNSHKASDVEFLIGLTIFFRLGNQESNFSVMTGSLLPLFVALYVIFRFGPPILSRLLPRQTLPSEI